MLNGKDYKLSRFHTNGLGGFIQKSTSKEEPSLSYIVKTSEQYQSVNEYVAQRMLAAMGLPAIKSELIEIDGRIYGAVCYVPELKRVHFTSQMTAEQRNDFCVLFTLNGMLNNQDTLKRKRNLIASYDPS